MSFLVIDQADDGIEVSLVKSGSTEKSIVVQKDGLLRAMVHICGGPGKLKDLRAVAVRVGAGRFSGTRIATVTANALLFALGVPVLSMQPGQTVQQALQSTLGGYVKARYSAPPSISSPKA